MTSKSLNAPSWAEIVGGAGSTGGGDAATIPLIGAASPRNVKLCSVENFKGKSIVTGSTVGFGEGDAKVAELSKGKQVAVEEPIQLGDSVKEDAKEAALGRWALLISLW